MKMSDTILIKNNYHLWMQDNKSWNLKILVLTSKLIKLYPLVYHMKDKLGPFLHQI